MPLITIILTTLNSERYLGRSIDSCLNQTLTDFELLIVDGGSQDHTLEIVAEYRDSHIRVLRQANNEGKLPGALNLGMACAAGDFITWTQDDCWYEPQALRSMWEYLEANPEVAFVYTDFIEVDAQGAYLRYHEVAGPDHLLEGDVVGQCFLFRREVYDTVGPQNVSYYSVHELPWRLKIAQQYRLQELHMPLMYYTVHDGSLTGRFGHWNEERKAASAIYREGYITERAYRVRMAKLDIDQAYEECILRGDFATFRKHAWAGVRQDPRWLRNIGLCKLLIRSFLPRRDAYRAKLLAVWLAQEADRQHELRLKYAPYT